MIIINNIVELSSKTDKNGRRHFKALLYTLQDPAYIVNGAETEGHWNENGLSFIEEYAEKNLDSINDMSISVEFLDEERTLINGHGFTGVTDDELPIFEDATVVGHFTKGYIDDFTDGDRKGKAVYGEGFIDEMRYPNFVRQLEQDIENGYPPKGSIEITKPMGYDGIVYLSDYKGEGRIPVKYFHSGYALLSVEPADNNAQIMELNNKEGEDESMDEKTIALITDAVKAAVAETNSEADEYEAKIASLEEIIAAKDAEITELKDQLAIAIADSETAKNEVSAANESVNELNAKVMAMETAKRIEEFNSAVSVFTEEQKSYAKDEIAAFNADPYSVEINAVTDKIYTEIGKKALENAEKKVTEINSLEDLFQEIASPLIECYDELF